MKFIFCSDLHLRQDNPICRTDDNWFETQFLQLSHIANEARKREVPIIIGGDLFHTPTVPDSIKNMFFNAFARVEVYAIAGQHDIKNHTMKNMDSGSFGVLVHSLKISFPYAFGRYANYNEELEGTDTGLYFFHRLVFASESDMPPNVKAITATDLLKEYPDAKWIFCGDNHHGFHFEVDGRHVIMGGCMNRQTSDMDDYQPVVWYIDTDEEKVEKIPVPDDVKIVKNVKIKEQEAARARIGAWMEVIKDSSSVNFDYKYKVETEMSKTKDLTEGAKNIIRGYLDE